MRKYIIGAIVVVAVIVAAALIATGAFAYGPPLPIVGTVTNYGSLTGYVVTVTNIRTGDSVTATTDENGMWQVDSWTNYPYNLRDTDTFSSCTSGVCVTSGIDSGVVNADIILSGAVVPKPCPEPGTCTVCPDPIVCPEPNVCPVPVVCPEPTVCPVPPVYDATTTAAITAVIGLCAGTGGTLYVTKKKATKKKSATTTVKVKSNKGVV